MVQARSEVVHLALSDEVARRAPIWFSWEKRIETLKTLWRSQWLA